jgi:tetratricopeptide (TPR) repeat protein
MESHFLVLLIGFSYAVLFAGMAALRGEGFSMQFTLEAVALTVLVAAGDYLSDSPVNPALFLAFLYLVTMRVRLLVDLATMFSNRGRQKTAISILQTALRLFPDRPSRLIALVSMGIVQLRRENPASAQSLLETVLEEAKQGGLGMRHAAATYYNLGIALRQQGEEARAVRHFREAADGFPSTPYARAAQRALEERRRGKKPPGKAEEAERE